MYLCGCERQVGRMWDFLTFSTNVIAVSSLEDKLEVDLWDNEESSDD